MKRSKKIVLVIVPLVIAFIILLVLYTFRAAPDTVKRQKAHFALTAENFVAMYESDETTTDAEYLDKIILVEGEIANIVTSKEGRTIIALKGSFSGNVSCILGQEVKLGPKYVVGSNVKIKGLCTGYLMDVLMKQCCIVE